MFGWDVSQSLDLQHPGRVKNRRQLFVGDADLAIVHETQQGFHVTILDIAQDDDRMLARIRLEEVSEVRAASGQHHLVSGE